MKNYCIKNKELKNDEEFEQFCMNHNNGLSKKQIEYTDFSFWIMSQKDMNNEFYKKIGQDIWEFEKNFVSAKYIEEQNVMNLILKVDNKDKRFIIHAI